MWLKPRIVFDRVVVTGPPAPPPIVRAKLDHPKRHGSPGKIIQRRAGVGGTDERINPVRRFFVVIRRQCGLEIGPTAVKTGKRNRLFHKIRPMTDRSFDTARPPLLRGRRFCQSGRATNLAGSTRHVNEFVLCPLTASCGAIRTRRIPGLVAYAARPMTADKENGQNGDDAPTPTSR